jgi:hypothetical protein
MHRNFLRRWRSRIAAPLSGLVAVLRRRGQATPLPVERLSADRRRDLGLADGRGDHRRAAAGI